MSRKPKKYVRNYNLDPEEKQHHNQQNWGTKQNFPFKEANINFTRLLRATSLALSENIV